ncbi:CMRF35-like molecule 5 isoform X2 [Triplophysa rosa]|uniref:CMRF35-like molecule 5 isoform X2 n=1 Tax=Triplophysa rosa TaxID=992332 RepID=UPI002545F983|nr:CMRF35-like molecule 5 isoform X2 [Triplophysa rosa]
MTALNAARSHSYKQVYSSKMKFFCAVCSWMCLSGFGISATDWADIYVKGREGEQVTVTCIHDWASTNRKYFCRGQCKDRDVLVSSDRSSNGRFSLKDFGNGKFTVTITDLKKTDSGIYWCGVDRVGADTYGKVNLRVSKADTHTTLRTPRTSTSTSFTPAPDDITNSVSLKGPVLPHTPEDQTFFDKAGHLMYTAVGLTVMLVILGVILYVYKKKKRKSHSSSGRTAADDERRTTITTETAGDYEDITETQQRTDPHTPTTVYSAVNHHSAANQIPDSSLYSNLSIQPSNTDTVIYATIDLRKKQGPQTFRTEDTVTYDIIFCS